MSVVTRFAPSPTGFLHIGGARTALFNYLFARHHGGKYLLRIEDTDRERSTADAVAAIHDGLAWLGLSGDEAPVYQSGRAERHQQVAEHLLSQGYAYRCYLTADELGSLREEARKKGHVIRSPWRDIDPANAPDRPFTIRLKMPLEGSTTLDDAVQGPVTLRHDQLDDLVMLRGDGTPTYMLAVVVDDHDMGITHIIRGDDHLNNAFRQQQIFRAMEWPVPVFAHIPLIHGSDGAKLSKRHGALSALAYRDLGLLPDAVCNYLLRLGWSHGDDEIISRQQAIDWFDLGGIGKAAARFDMQKLMALNAVYLRDQDDDMLISSILEQVEKPSAKAAERLKPLMGALKERATNINELHRNAGFALHDGPPQQTEEASLLLDAEAILRLRLLHAALPKVFDDEAAIKAWLHDWLQTQNLKMRDIGPPLRAAVTGMKQSPDIILTLRALGREEVAQRLAAICQ